MGPTIMITGAANGIGAAIATRFAEQGKQLVLIDRDARGQELAGGLGAIAPTIFIQCDLRRPEEVAIAVASGISHFGRLDTLVNNAGITLPKALAETRPEDWDDVQAINLRAAYLTTRAATEALAATGNGSIVNISSYHSGATIENFAAYASSKAGVLGLTKSSALELAPRGIRVNAVSPGVVHTAMVDAWLDTVQDRDAALSSMLAKQPLGRLGKAEEIASAVAFLASAEAAYITGTNLLVDGGVSARLWHA